MQNISASFSDVHEFIDLALKLFDNDISAMPESHRIPVLACAAQGIIEGNGFAYFYYREFNGVKSYREFVAAYELIGDEIRSRAIHESFRLFSPFPEPPMQTELRRDIMAKKKQHELDWLTELERKFYDANPTVMLLLKKWIVRVEL